MTTGMVPVDAIDPLAVHDRWVHQFEWHLDILPPLMDAIVTATLPHIRATQTDKIVITGGGPVDNMTAFLRGIDVDEHGRLGAGGAAADAEHLWALVVDYTEAVAAWINMMISVPYAPDLPPLVTARGRWVAPRPDPDPLGARRDALMVAGWLSDHAQQISDLEQLEEAREGLFGEIRRLRASYGVVPHSRRPRVRCTTCGERSVVVAWVDSPNRSPKSVRAAKCRTCGETWQDATEPPPQAHTARQIVSKMCADLIHEACVSIHCECGCHNLAPVRPNRRNHS